MAALITNLAGDNLSYTTPGTTSLVDANANALLSGITVADLKGGTIKVSFASGGAATDTLSLNYQSSYATGTVALFNGQLYVNAFGVGAYSVGTASGGTAGSDLTISFNNTQNVTLEAAQVLLRNLTFATTEAGIPVRNIAITVIDRNAVAGDAAVVTVNGAPPAAPTDITLSSSQVAENTSTISALNIGTLGSVDANTTDKHSYSVVGGADQAAFQITNSTLQFKAGTKLNYEAQSSYAVTVRSTDSGSLTFDKTLTVTLSNVDDAPVLAANKGTSLTAGTSTIITSTLLQATDEDNTAAQLTYTLKADASLGTLMLNNNALQANSTFTQADVNAGLLSYSSKGTGGDDSFSFIVADSGGNKTTQASFNLAVAGAPTNVTLSSSQVAENTSTVSTMNIGTLGSVDANMADTHTYSIVGGADQAAFQITNSTLQFKAGTTLNYEAQSSYAVTVRSTDSGNLTFDKTLTVSLSDVNDAPVLAVNKGTSLTVGSSTTITNTLLQVTDEDNTPAQLTYTLVATPDDGKLTRNGTLLSANDSFTQADINGGHVKYLGTRAGTDSIDFIVADGAGGQLGQHSFSIVVIAEPEAELPPPGVVLTALPSGSDLRGTPQDDLLAGLDGRDVFRPGMGRDMVDGGNGIDTVIFDANYARYQIVRSEGGIRVVGEGTDTTMINVERLNFSDRKVAFDLHAGITAIVLGATFGSASVHNQQYAAIGIDLLDSGALDYAGLAQLAINSRLGGPASDEAVVNLLYSNVVGHAPGQAEVDYYTGLIDSGLFTQATLGMYAAQTVENQINIDLVGLALSGLEYVSVAS